MKLFMQRMLLFISMAVFSVPVWAQDEKKLDVDINVNKGHTNWYAQPWVWIIGGAVFILLLVALLRPRERAE